MTGEKLTIGPEGAAVDTETGADLPRQGALRVYPRSSVQSEGTTYFLARSEVDGRRLLGVEGNTEGFAGTQTTPGGVLLFPLTADNVATLRTRLPWLRPVPLGLRVSAGFGDRLGLATAGHVRAIRDLPSAGRSIGPLFAQQSVRENSRTGRTPQQVLDDATWGVFQVGWRAGWGADADHLKTPQAADAFIDAGYTMFTTDPGDWVDDAAQGASSNEVEASVRALPWEMLEDTPRDLERRYSGNAVELAGGPSAIDRETVWRAASKYGHAVGRTVEMYRHVKGRMGDRPFDFEVSVDETESPTSLMEHFYIASELRRLGVRWTSLAPRFVGSFEKGVDYIGSLSDFSEEFARHADVARRLGPYKLSLHSGSDKFSIYGIAARLTTYDGIDSQGPLIHLKTAGTSYLEALRTVARVNSGLFREILDLARDRYETDRATYHISALLTRVPAAADLGDSELVGLIDQFDARQVLHVTFGSVLDRFREPLLAELRRNEELHHSLLATHFSRHLKPFCQTVTAPSGPER
jgi:hypothetical protein